MDPSPATAGGRTDSYEHDGLRFEVVDTGPLSAPVAVLLHGFPTDATSWERIAGLLHDGGLRTVAPTLRGYSPGASPHGRAVYALGLIVGDVLALLDTLGVRQVHLVGHDWGGALAWAVAGAHPERVASVTVLSTPHPAAMSRAVRHLDQARRSWYMAAFQVPWLPEQVLSRRLGAQLRRWGMPDQDAARYAARFATPESLTGPLNWYRALPHSRGVVHRCRVPATFVWGRHDQALGREAAEATRSFVVADYELVELDEGHWLPELAAPECAAAILRRVHSVLQ
jgi:pimeloyl-ACP methyl ester carboxylesterase